MTMINLIFEATLVSSNDIQDIEPEVILSSNWLPTFSFQSTLQSSVQAKFTCIGVRFLQKHYANFEHINLNFDLESQITLFAHIGSGSVSAKSYFGNFVTRSKQNFSIPHICYESHENTCVNFFGQCKFLQI